MEINLLKFEINSTVNKIPYKSGTFGCVKEGYIIFTLSGILNNQTVSMIKLKASWKNSDKLYAFLSTKTANVEYNFNFISYKIKIYNNYVTIIDSNENNIAILKVDDIDSLYLCFQYIYDALYVLYLDDCKISDTI